MKRLDPEVLGEHLDHLLRAAWRCVARGKARRISSRRRSPGSSPRPRLLRGQDELPYLMQAVRNTFLSSRRTAARRPRVVTTLEEFDTADRRTAASAEEAVIAAQVFPAIARLPESFRLALVAIDVAGLSYREAARVLGAPEATVTTRLYRARHRVARELDPERFEADESKGARRTSLVQPTAARCVDWNDRVYQHHDNDARALRACAIEGRKEGLDHHHPSRSRHAEGDESRIEAAADRAVALMSSQVSPPFSGPIPSDHHAPRWRRDPSEMPAASANQPAHETADAPLRPTPRTCVAL